MRIINITKVLWYKVSKILFWIPVSILISLLFTIAVFQVPQFQTRLINTLAEWINANTSFGLDVGNVNLTWYDEMLFEDIRLYQVDNDSTVISIKKLSVDIELFNLIIYNKLNADIVDIVEPNVHLIKFNDSTDVNLSRFITEVSQSTQSDSSSTGFSFSVDEIKIKGGVFTFNDTRHDSIPAGMDYYHVHYRAIDTYIENFLFESDSMAFYVESLKANDPTNQLNLKTLFGQYYLTPKSMSLYDCEIQTDKSTITDSIVFFYEKPSDFTYFNDSIRFYLKTKNTTIDTDELALFNSSLSSVKQVINFSGVIEGSVPQLKGSNLKINLSEHSQINANMEFYGFPNIEESFMKLSLDPSQLNPIDFKDYLDHDIYSKIQKLGIVSFKGEFLGFLTDFVANSQCTTSFGVINTDLNFKIPKNKIAQYKGQLSLKDCNLQSFFGEEIPINTITMNGNIAGKGINLKTANFELDALIDSVIFMDYNYHAIRTSGHFENEYFTGQLSINDPNVQVKGNAEIDLRNAANKYIVSATLDTLNLLPLGFSNIDLSVSTEIDINMKGLQIDDLRGYVNLHKSKLVYNKKRLDIDSLKLISSFFDSKRFIIIETDGLKAELNGHFSSSDLFLGLKEYYDEILINLRNDPAEKENYYINKKNKALVNLTANLDMRLYDLNKFIQPFIPTFDIAQDIRIKCEFKQDSTTIFSMYSKIDSLTYEGNSINKNTIDINLSKKYYEPDILASIYGSSELQKWSNLRFTQNATIDIIWFENAVDIWTNIEEEAFKNKLQLNSSIEFKEDETWMKLNPSIIKVLNKNWQLYDQNKIIIKGDNYFVEQLRFKNGIEAININGWYSSEHDEPLIVDIWDLDISHFNTFLPINLKGLLEGKVKIQRKENNHIIESDLVIRALKLDDYLIGNLFALSDWEPDINKVNTKWSLVRNGIESIELYGAIYPNETSKILDLTANFISADLRLAQPFLKGKFSNIEGLFTGKFSIVGDLQTPIINGKGDIDKLKGRLNYLNTTYEISGPVVFEENKIILQKIELYDTERNRGVLSGKIYHDYFTKFNFNIETVFKSFKLLNTTPIDNTAYYGTAYATGSVTFNGPIDNFYIAANAVSNKGTRLFIPIGNTSSYTAGGKEFIHFKELSDEKIDNTSNIALSNNSQVIKGINLEFKIELTQDANVELIFDVKSGDIIRGRGDGNIELNVNTDGDFNMFGDYIIEKGGYNFTLYNIINKEFDIQKGSSISWYGDPYGAQMKINASYRQLAALTPILKLSEADLKSVEATKKYPSIVKMSLTGDLLTPDILFDIDFENYPQKIGDNDINAQLNAFKTTIASNVQEMNRQVFSLLVLRKLSPENSFNPSFQTIQSSLSEFVSNQLSYWATQVDENLEIDVNLTTLDQDAFNTFQLRLSYTFLDGRLRVTRGGGFVNQENKSDITNIIGDWSVEYLLTNDGRFKAKMYSRTNLNAINSDAGENQIERGFSLQFVRSFDELKQILRDKRDKPTAVEPNPNSSIIINN